MIVKGENIKVGDVYQRMNDIFQKEFDKVLNDRYQVNDFMKNFDLIDYVKSNSKYYTDDIKLDVSNYIYSDTDNGNWENPIDKPGYNIKLNPIKIDNYEFKLIDILLNSNSVESNEFPLKVTIYGDIEKLYYVNDITSLESLIWEVINSDSTKKLIDRMLDISKQK